MHSPSTHISAGPSVSTTATADPVPRPLRVLVVDDDPVLLDITGRKVRRAGCVVAKESHPQAARLRLRLAPERGEAFDAVVCDGLGGDWRVVHKAAGRIPFLLLSGDRNQVEAARRAGVPALVRAPLAHGPKLVKALRGLPNIWPPAELLELRPRRARPGAR